MSNSNLQFRVATPDDAPQVQQLVESAFRAEDIRPNWAADMELGSRFRISVDEIMAVINKVDTAFLIATSSAIAGSDSDNNDVVGALVGGVAVSKRGDLARISLLAVNTNHQRGGIGRQIVTYAEEYCRRTWGVTKLGLNALSTRPELISWYMRCGYQKTGEVTPFDYRLVNGAASSEDLYFVEFEKDLNAA